MHFYLCSMKDWGGPVTLERAKVIRYKIREKDNLQRFA